MSFELGEAFVRVRGDTKGVEGDVSRAFSGSAITGSVMGLGGLITKTIGGALVGVTGLLGGMALKGGLTRLLDTEDARVQLQRMGLSLAEVDQMIDGVDKTFDGTIFANPDGFKLGSMLYAAGLSLEDVNRGIAGTANIAAHANVPLDRVGEVMTKIAAGGKITGREMMQLAMMGVPIQNILADSLGKSVEEVNAMVSAGELTSGMFLDAIEGSEMLEGAALAAGNTTRGAFTNARTALSRLGEAFLSPFFGEGGLAVRGFQALREVLRGLVPHAEALGEKFAAWVIPKVRELGERISELVTKFQADFAPGIRLVSGFLKEHSGLIASIAGAFAAAIPLVGGFSAGFFIIAKAFALVMKATPLGIILALAAGLIYAYQNSETFRNVIQRVGEVAQRVGGWLRDALGNAISFVSELFTSAKPRFDSIRESFDTIVAAVGPVVSWIGERIPGAFSKLWSIVRPIVGFLITLLTDTLKMAFDGLVQIVQGALGIVSGIFDVFAGLFTGDWSRLWDGVKAIFQGFWNLIVGIVKVYLAGTVMRLISAPLRLIANLWRSTWNGIRSFFVSIWNALVSIVRGGGNQATGVVQGAMNLIRSVITSVWNAIRVVVQGVTNAILSVIRSVFTSITGAIRSAVQTAQAVVGTAFSAIRSGVTTAVNAVRAIVSSVFSAIRSLMGTAANGARTAVTSAFNAMRSAVSGAISNLLGIVRRIPGQIRSALGNVGSLLRDSGRQIIQGLIGGITAMAGKVKDAVSGVLKSARNLLPFSPAKEGPFSGKGWSGHSGRAIAEDLADGLQRSEGAVVSQAQKMAQKAAQALQVSPKADAGLVGSSAGSAAPGGRGGQVSYEQHFHGYSVDQIEAVTRRVLRTEVDQWSLST